MRIYLGDLFYVKKDSKGIPVPFNVALVASYLKSRNDDLDIVLFKDPLKMFNAIKDSPPDLIGLSNYSWNSNLNIAMMTELKKFIPNIPVIMGGPNFPKESPGRIDTFFENRPFVTLFVNGEGESGMSYIVDYIKKNGSLDKFLDDAPQNFWGYDSANRKVLRGPNPGLERINMDDTPSPYLSGMLDEFLRNGQYSPIFETNRGCPYSCAFCVWGQATESKIRPNNIDRIKAELRHCAQIPQLAGELAFFSDANFGILKRDVDIADEILACHKEHNFPNRLYIYFAKNPTPIGLKCAETLAPLTDMTLSRQTMSPVALTNIRRQNMNIEAFEDIIKAVRSRGAATGTEMIYGIPGETYRSYVDGIIGLSKSAEFIQQYALLLMWGSELSTDSYRKLHGIKGSWRPIHDCWADFGPFASVEFEEIVTQTNQLSFDDWKNIRLFHIFTQFFYAEVFKSFRQELAGTTLNVIDIAERMMMDSENWPATFSEVMNLLKQKISDELVSPDHANHHEHELVKFNNDREYIEQLNGYFYALAPYFKSMLHAENKTLDDLFVYLKAAIARWYQGTVSEETIKALQYQFSVSRALSIAYNKIEEQKTVKLGDVTYSLFMDPQVARVIPNIKLGSHEAAYKIKMEYVVSSRDKAFCYQLDHATSRYKDHDRQGVTVGQQGK